MTLVFVSSAWLSFMGFEFDHYPEDTLELSSSVVMNGSTLSLLVLSNFSSFQDVP
jgi:hypothetical protein